MEYTVGFPGIDGRFPWNTRSETLETAVGYFGIGGRLLWNRWSDSLESAVGIGWITHLVSSDLDLKGSSNLYEISESGIATMVSNIRDGGGVSNIKMHGEYVSFGAESADNSGYYFWKKGMAEAALAGERPVVAVAGEVALSGSGFAKSDGSIFEVTTVTEGMECHTASNIGQISGITRVFLDFAKYICN